MVKVGIVGLGEHGLRHARIAKNVSGLDLVAICDSDDSVVGTAMEQLGDESITSYADYTEMLDKADLGAVIIAAPAKYNAEFLELATDRNLHVLVEKPVCLTPEEAEGLQHLVGGYDGAIAVGYLLRFSPILDECKNLLGKYGLKVIEYEGTWIKDRRHDTRKHGGVVRQEATHLVDLWLHSLIGYKNIWIEKPVKLRSFPLWDEETHARFDLSVMGYPVTTEVSYDRTIPKRHISLHCMGGANKGYTILLAFDKKEGDDVYIDRIGIYSSEARGWYNYHSRGFDVGTVFPQNDQNFKKYDYNKMELQQRAFEKLIRTDEGDPNLCSLQQGINVARLCCRICEMGMKKETESEQFEYR